MENQSLFFSKKVQGTFDQVYKKVLTAVENNGFGIVTELSMDKKLKEKLDVSIDTYHILGICNPKMAYEAMQIEENIGVFLPCKLVLKKVGENLFEIVSFNPSLMMGILDNSEMSKVADQVSTKIQDILEAI